MMSDRAVRSDALRRRRGRRKDGWGLLVAFQRPESKASPNSTTGVVTVVTRRKKKKKIAIKVPLARRSPRRTDLCALRCAVRCDRGATVGRFCLVRRREREGERSIRGVARLDASFPDAKGQEPTPSSLYFVHTARQLRLDRTGGSSVCLSRAEEKKPEERPQALSAG